MKFGKVDWKGVAMAMNQLKELTEPSRFEIMEHEYHLRGMEDEKERKFQFAKDMFDTQYKEMKDNNVKIDEIKKNIGDISMSALNLSAENRSNETNFNKIFTENDSKTLDSYHELNASIGQKVDSQLKDLNDYSKIYENVLTGKQLFKREQGSYLDENNEEVADWDLDGNLSISEDEYSQALEGTIRLMKTEYEKNKIEFDDRGIREGFWADYNRTQNVQDEISMETDLYNLLEASNYDLEDPKLKAFKKGLTKSEVKRDVYFADQLERDMKTFSLYKEALKDGGESAIMNALNISPDDTNALGVEGAYNKAQNKMRNDMLQILSDANQHGYSHYFVDKTNKDFDETIEFEYIIEGDAEQKYNKKIDNTFSDFGFTKELYSNLGNTPIPAMENGQTTGYLDDETSRTVGMEMKSDFEFLQNTISKISTAEKLLEGGENYSALEAQGDEHLLKMYGNEEEMKEIASKFKTHSKELRKVFPKHFEGKEELELIPYFDEIKQMFRFKIQQVNPMRTE